MIRLGIIDKNQTLRENLKQQFNDSQYFECVIAVDSVEKFLRLYSSFLKIEIILLDINLNGMSGIAGIPHLHRKNTDWDIIIFTVEQDKGNVFKAISAGVRGYLLKDLSQEELEQKLLTVQNKGGALLAPQVAGLLLDYFQPNVTTQVNTGDTINKKELQIIRFLVDSLSYQEVADKIGISLNGVRYHIKNIYRKLGVHSRAEVVKKYLSGDIK